VTDFDPSPIFTVLNRHGVEFVVVGGYAARLYGARRPTTDADVTPNTTFDNLKRLAAALRELCARIRSDAAPDGLPFDTSAEALRGISMLNLTTPFGDLDLTFTPAGFPAGYDQLISHAVAHVVNSLTIQVAALQDIITSKTEAGRQKDILALPELLELAERVGAPDGGAARE
jgi:hypothetical protein